MLLHTGHRSCSLCITGRYYNRKHEAPTNSNSNRGKYRKTGAVVWRCSAKKLFTKISQNSQEDICTGISFNNVAGVRSTTLLKINSTTGFFPVQFFSCTYISFAKFLKAPFLQNICKRLLLEKHKDKKIWLIKKFSWLKKLKTWGKLVIHSL